MGTIIDELLVSLGIDKKQYTRDLAEADKDLKEVAENAKKRGGEVEGAANQMGVAFAKLRGELTGLFLTFMGARSITAFATNLVQTTAAAGRAGQVLGLSANTVNAWGDAIKAAGGDASEAAAVFGKISDIQANFIRNPGALNMPLMGQLGIRDRSAFDNPEQLMLSLADQYQREHARAVASGNPAEVSRTQATFRQRVKELLGVSDEWVAMIEKGRGPLQQEIDLYKEKDRVTEEDARQAQELIRTMEHLQKSLIGVARETGLIGFLDDLASVMDGLAGNSDHLSERGRVLALGFWGLLHPIDALASLMADWGIISRQTALDVIGDDRPHAGNTSLMPGAGGAAGWAAQTNADVGRFAGGGVGGAQGVVSYLMANGLTREQALGVTAGIHAESGLNPNARNGSSGAFGIGQWLGPRKARLFAAYGRNPSMQQQLAFLLSELRGGDPGGASVLSQRTARGVMMAYARDFMRPQGAHGEHMADLFGNYRRGDAFLRQAGGLGPVTVHVDARGATNPEAVGRAAGGAVRQALRGRSTVANSNTGQF